MKTRLNACLKVMPVLVMAVGLSAPAAAYAMDNACTIVTAADAEALLGEPVGAPQNEGLTCRFKSSQTKGLKGKSLSVTIRYSGTDLKGSTPGIIESLKSAGYKNVHEVSGVGASAVWGVMVMMSRPMDELTVIKDKSVMLIILSVGMPEEATALQRSKDLAHKLLPKT